MNRQQKKRYQRQMLFPEIGEKGQEALLKARVVQVGCGGLGSTLAQCMVRAGIKSYTIIDQDVSQIDNLHRQFLFDENDALRKSKKALAATRKLKKADSGVEVKGVARTLTSTNADRLLSGHDLVLDGLDNMDTRYLVNDWCVKNRVPWIYGGVVGGSGMVMVIIPGKGPCLRCLFPDPQAARSAPNTDTGGIINTLPAHVATIQATEAQKLLMKSPYLVRDLRLIDLWSGECQRLRILRNPECPCCAKKRFQFLE